LSSRATIAKQAIFVAAAVACAVPWSFDFIAAAALALGALFALSGQTCWPDQTKKIARVIMQACIVALGLRLDISQLAHAAVDGLALAIGTIFGAIAVGLTLGRLLGIAKDLSLLVSCGTAICGGSAIASVGSAIKAKSTDMAMATAVVFTLNAVGVLTLPAIGRAIGMNEIAFGTWAGVAIHDMASVSAVAKNYRVDATSLVATVAMDQANVVKLTRVLWLVPITLLAAWWRARELRKSGEASSSSASVQVPWFIGLFLLASLVRTFVPSLAEFAPTVKLVAGCGFQVALFLIGAGVSRSALQSMGWRALVHAVVLWIVLAGVTAFVVTRA
jgi:uncharacterized integral membrane protein (TIGR00698 family)